MLEKVTVAEEVVGVIRKLRGKGLDLDFIMRSSMNQKFNGESECLNAYKVDDLVLIWLGHYEIAEVVL